MAFVLGFDTSAASTSVAVCEGARVLAQADTDESAARHAECLLPQVERCLAQSGVALGRVDVIAVGIGPGSFTGVRVGVATAKGLGLCLQKPVVGVVSLTALAAAAIEQCAPDVLLAPLLDAFKGELFGALYRVTSNGPVVELPAFHARVVDALGRVVTAAQGRPLAVFGGGFRRYQVELGSLAPNVRVLSHELDAPRARQVARLGLAAFDRGEVPELSALAPLYVRDSDAQLPKLPLRV